MQNLGINKILLALVVVLLLALAALAYWQYFKEPAYYAVSLQTGEVYFGRLSWFPTPALKDVHLIRQNPNDQKNPFSLQKFSDSFWGPGDKMKLNWDKVVWVVKLRPDSQIINFIKGQTSR